MKYMMHTNYAYAQTARYFAWPPGWTRDMELIDEDSKVYSVALCI